MQATLRQHDLVISTKTHKPFVLVSGLPGSGKTTLGRQLASALNLPLIDKDDILERLLEAKGVGNAEWRRMLSRESDVILQREAMASDGAVLVSFWRVDGMPGHSGTPTAWLSAISGQLVNVFCVCEPDAAAERFLKRKRHPGHLDMHVSHSELLADLQSLSRLDPLDVGQRIDVETQHEFNLDDIVRQIRRAFAK